MTVEERIMRRDGLVRSEKRYLKLRMKLRYPYFPESGRLSDFYNDLAVSVSDSVFSVDMTDRDSGALRIDGSDEIVHPARIEKTAVKYDVSCEFAFADVSSGNEKSEAFTIEIRFAVFHGRYCVFEKKVIHSWVEIDGEYYLKKHTV